MSDVPIFDYASSGLPIAELLPTVLNTLNSRTRVLVQAPPGAGKSTLLPLALLSSGWLTDKQIWLLEPRRLAARQVASRMAELLGEKLGQTVGLITRQDRHISKQSRLVVMTEGVLTNRLLADQSIEECGAILFDEFHERNLNSDLGLALSYECQQLLREDLRILVMSATLSGESLAEALDAPILTSEGRSYPVDSIYLGFKQHTPLEEQVAAAIRKALSEQDGHVLVFLPGVREINQTRELLGQLTGIEVLPLHGQLSPQEQQKAISGNGDQRRVILATSVAETSLTIEGIRVVIDSGLERRAQFNPRTGMDELVTFSASQASAEQRSGRAGRLEAGVCYRLWSAESQHSRTPFSSAEIELVDLSGFALALANWGSLALKDYLLLDVPPSGRWQASLDLLHQLNALKDNKITLHGEKMARLGVHPRLANMLLSSSNPATACALAALLGEGDPLRFNTPHSNIQDRIDLLAERPTPKRFRQAEVAYKKTERILIQAKRLAAMLGLPSFDPVSLDSSTVGELLALAYPDRLAQRRGSGFRLSNGQGVETLNEDSIKSQDWLAAADISTSRGKSIIRLAAPISLESIESLFSDQLTKHKQVTLTEQGKAKAQLQTRFSKLVLRERSFQPDQTDIEHALLDFVQNNGLDVLPWDDSTRRLKMRMQYANQTEPESFPKVDQESLLTNLNIWLLPFLQKPDLSQVPLEDALKCWLGWENQALLDQQFPTHIALPSGRSAQIDYPTDANHTPKAQAKLQECFGLLDSPTVANGKIKIGLELLSPGKKPLALTHDLPHFWKNIYPEVRKEMRGRYNKHPWPENPLEAQATSKTNRQLKK